MKLYNNLYGEIISLKNLIVAEKKARKGKTSKDYVKEFEEDFAYNLKILHSELENQTYKPMPLKSFILRDPKTRKISKSIFKDRIVHHAIINIIEPIFDKRFIYDSYANRKGKGTISAINRFTQFQRKVTNNFSNESFCLKCDIKHYFQEVDRELLLELIKKKINCTETIELIEKILNNFEGNKGMPLGNLTSQFFANIYLNELDQFVKHKLRAKYYIRYVDDFILLHESKGQLQEWKKEIEKFLRMKLKLQLHPDKSKIISLSKGVDFVGFKIFYYFKIIRRRNFRSFKVKLRKLKQDYKEGIITKEKFISIIQGWFAYVMWGDTHKLREKLIKEINSLAIPN